MTTLSPSDWIAEKVLSESVFTFDCTPICFDRGHRGLRRPQMAPKTTPQCLDIGHVELMIGERFCALFLFEGKKDARIMT